MLMLTHTYLLQKTLGKTGRKDADPDIYIYNITPDLLTIHRDINSAKTHNIKRFSDIPEKYPQTAYVMFHLLVDDLAHHGSICLNAQEEFNPDSQGYCYLKGKELIDNLLDVHKTIQNEISYNEAAYRSHLIIEMIYDLVIFSEIESLKTISLLVEAINFTVEHKLDEFISTISWLYNLQEDDIRSVMKDTAFYLTEKRMERIMNIEGRIRLYADKFGLNSEDKLFNEGITDLFIRAKNLLEQDEKELFLQLTTKAIKDYGWHSPIK